MDILSTLVGGAIALVSAFAIQWAQRRHELEKMKLESLRFPAEVLFKKQTEFFDALPEILVDLNSYATTIHWIAGESENEEELKMRTKQFALRVIRLCESLPKTATGAILGKQLLRSATSVGANYRAACRGRSKAEFIAKLGIVEEEADESLFWLELIAESGLLPAGRLAGLLREADEDAG